MARQQIFDSYGDDRSTSEEHRHVVRTHGVWLHVQAVLHIVPFISEPNGRIRREVMRQGVICKLGKVSKNFVPYAYREPGL